MPQCIYVHKFNEIKIPKPDSHIIQNMDRLLQQILHFLHWIVLNYLHYLFVSNADIQFS